MTTLTRRLALASAGLLAAPALLGARAARADAPWPNRPIRLVVPFSGGGATDVTARVIGERLSTGLGQPVVVDNRAGAGGNLGSDLVAKSDPDGHTLLMCTIGTASINQYLYSKLPFDPQKDLVPIANVNLVGNGIMVGPNVPAKDLKELIALAKSKKGELTFGTPGNGTSGHLTGEYFKVRAGVDLVHVPYRGSGNVIPDLLGGRIDIAFDNLPAYLPHIREGRMRLIAVTTRERYFATPEAPTVIESGIPDFESVAWFGLQAPAKTPKAVVERLDSMIATQMKDPEVLSRLRDIGSEPHYLNAAAFGQFIAAENKKWQEVVKISGAKLD